MSNASAAAHAVAWDSDPALPDWHGLPTLETTVHADACVVGLGGSGLAAVDELTGRGLSVAGIDAGRVAAGAAGRNGGILSAGGALLRDGDGVLSPDLRRDLYRDCLTELARLREQLGEAVIRPTGTLRLAGLPGEPEDAAEAADRAAEVIDVAAEAAVLRSWDVPIEDYDGPLGRGFYNPETAGMNPVQRAYGLASRLQARAQLFEHTRATAVQAGSVTTEHGQVQAPIIIIAVDGRLPQLVPQLARIAHTVRLQMLATAPVPRQRLPCPASFRRGYEWAQQDRAGRLLVGGGRDRFLQDETTTNEEPTAQIQAWITRAAARIASQPVVATHQWAASVSYTQDRRAPVVLVDDGVAACGAYSGSGNLVGPLAARAAVRLAADGTPPPGYFRSSL